ncbi:ABC transporter substrate-binding protein [Vagococcus elongatus]|uniref:ABC transporter substrate-binding protein n=1 Tax=Vagococcus elongatus TaxID=180344 RepID=A0A430B174_9ENTE|nr:ABC transporter substrate-binding protein [Vagococcus elongatus]RSU14093.1 ABC transporter substrate-binding protein [Vagococcus elongatus]
MKKKLLISSLVLMGAVGLTACSNSDSKKESSEKATVEVFNIKTETAEQMDNLVEKFEESHPDIDINMTTVGGGTDATAALQAKFSSGDEPAVFMLAGLSHAKAWSHTLYDLSDTNLTKKAIDGTLEGATYDGKVVGLPMNIEGYGWLVNKEIFEAAGVPIEKITSFADFKSAVETLDSKKDELGLKGVFGFSGGETWVTGQFSANFLAPEFNNSILETYSAEELKFEYADQMKENIDLAIKYNAKPLESMDYSTSVEEMFAGDKVAVIHQGNWIVPTLNSLDDTFAKEKLGIVPMYVESETEGKIVAGPAWYWCVNSNKSEKEIEASIEFINWMYTDEEAMTSIVDDFDFIPAYTNFSSDDIKDPLSKEIYRYLSDGKAVPWVHSSYPDGYGQNIIGVEIQSYAAENSTWEELSKKLIDTWNTERSK